MQVTETLSEGLKREFKVVVPAAELDAKVNERLNEIKDRVHINGFRPGKVPVAHLRKVYGRSAMAEVIETTVRDASSQIISERGLKLASEPKITMPTEEGAVEQMIAGKSDLSYSVAIEIVPPIELADFKGIKLEKPTAEVSDAEVEEGLQKLAERNRPYIAKAAGEKAANDDHVTMSFAGTVDGEPFEGGSGDDVVVHIGSGGFIPGFEEQLIGMTAGETRIVKVTFPPNYGGEKLAGKDAEFQVTAKSIEAPGETKVDEDFAKALGVESLDKLRAAIRERLEHEHAMATRQKVKRQLLDQLDKLHKFDPPPTLVNEEFDRVWSSVEDELKRSGRTFADENTTEEKARDDYRNIAERRVRLGLVLAEIGEKNNITVTEEELTRAVTEQVRQFPGQEQQAWEYFRKNPAAVAGLRAPIYEDKVVDFLLELANVTEKKVSREQLFKDDDEAEK